MAHSASDLAVHFATVMRRSFEGHVVQGWHFCVFLFAHVPARQSEHLVSLWPWHLRTNTLELLHTLHGAHLPLITSVVLLHLEHTVSSDGLHAAASNSLFCAGHLVQVWHFCVFLFAHVLAGHNRQAMSFFTVQFVALTLLALQVEQRMQGEAASWSSSNLPLAHAVQGVARLVSPNVPLPQGVHLS